jgi:hypothetical protein
MMLAGDNEPIVLIAVAATEELLLPLILYLSLIP